jgi:hypothetical protein
MKKIKNIVMLSLLAVVLSTTSCSDFLNVNTDPNHATTGNITPNLIFTQAENAIGTRQANRFVFLNNWMGYWSRSGTFIVEQEETTYKVANTFPETDWDQAYDILMDLNQVKTRALAVKDSVLTGASIILSAKLWQETVDQFGSIPYSKTFDYINNPRPAYDKATDIYADLYKQLDQAIVYLNAIAPKSTFATTDIIFARGGSLTTAIAQWKKFANTIKLRMFIRQSQMSGFVAPTAAQLSKIATDGGFLGAGEDVSVQPGYSDQVGKQNPFYGSFGFTPAGAPASTNNMPNNYFVNTIMGADDPRLVQFFAAPIQGTDYGALAGNKNAIGGLPIIVGSPINAGTATQDQFILPSYESLFFQAEAAARGWIKTSSSVSPQILFESAIYQSFVSLGVPNAFDADTTYIHNVPTAMWANAGATVDSKVKFIAFQKYVALCGIDAVESWSDLRRGVLVLPAGYLSNNSNRAASLPNVLPYPQTELTVNSVNMPKRSNIFTEKLFWQPQ